MGWFDTVAGIGTLGTYTAAKAVYGAAKDATTQDKAVAYDPDKSNFVLGNDPAYAATRAGTLGDKGQGAYNEARGRTDTQDQAAALGYQQAQGNAANLRAGGANGRGNAYGAAGTQLQQGTAGQDAANRQGFAYNTQGQLAETRRGPAVNTAGAAHDMANAAASRDASMAGVGALNNYAQQGPGPSAAQSQMQQGSEASMASALALARSGRNGADAGAERNAMFQNAATNQQTNQQLGTLRANEEATWKNQQLQALSGASAAAQGVRGQDLQSQGMSLQTAQTNAQLDAQQRGLNDATALGYSSLANQQFGQGAQYNLGMQNAANASYARGDQYNASMQGLANQSVANGQQFVTGMGGLANQSIAQGQAYDMGMQGQSNGIISQQLGANMGYEQLRSGNQMTANASNVASDAQGDAALWSAAATAAGVAAKSDARSKKNITPLEGFAAPDVRQPDTDALDEAYTALGGEPVKNSAFGFKPKAPDTAALDSAYSRESSAPAVDLRPARGFAYDYKDPGSPGAAPGRHVGPMAQDLERTAAAGTVHNTPTGKQVDTKRLTMVNTAALSEQQRKMQALEEQVNALRDSAGSNPWPGYDRSALDEAYRRQGGVPRGLPYAPPTARFADAQALGYGG